MNTFRGYLVIAHVPGQNDTLLGQFMPQNANQQTLNCDAIGANPVATVAHNNPARTDFQSMQFMWQAPAVEPLTSGKSDLVHCACAQTRTVCATHY